MILEFTKMHGLGNDFVVLDGRDRPIALSVDSIRLLADRRHGIGCDQVLLLDRGEEGMHARLRIFNTDGSEVEQCGNGVRCVARFLRGKGLSADPVRLKTAAGRIEVHEESGNWRVNMGVPEFEPARIPLDAGQRRDRYRIELPAGVFEVYVLSMGNPHAVLVVDDVDATPLDTIAPALQQSGRFPRGVNVGVMQILSRDSVKLRVFERGVGETLACGSGACAAVVAGRLHDGLEPQVDVGLKGGRLRIRWAGEGEAVWMTGPATSVFEGRIDL